jgi:hypothetical protein
MLLGVLVIFSTGMAWFVRSSIDAGVTKLQLAMSQTYTSKEEFRAHAASVQQKLEDIHADIAKIPVQQPQPVKK